MRYLLTFLFLLIALPAWGATYYADPAGSGTTCGSGTPCTLTYAVNTKATSGDTVIANAGTYTDVIDISNAGVTLQGTLDGSGNHLTLMNPYVDTSGSWTTDGDGVYKKSLGYTPWAMMVEAGGDKWRIPFARGTASMAEAGGKDWYDALHWGTGLNWCIWDANLAPAACRYVNMWDGFHALYGYNSGTSTLYVSFEDDHDVNSDTLYIAPDAESTVAITAANVTVKDLKIYAIHRGVSVEAADVTVDNCNITMGLNKIYKASGAIDNLTVQNSYLANHSYAEYVGEWSPGAHSGPAFTGAYDRLVFKHMYVFPKFTLTNDGSPGGLTAGVYSPGGTGSGMSLIDNTTEEIRNIFNIGTENNITISGNSFKNSPSVAIPIGPSITGSIYNNTAENVNIFIRFHTWGNYGAANTGDLKIYGNKAWSPPEIGEHFYIHLEASTGTFHATQADVWFYHNSFSGGRNVTGPSGYFKDWSGTAFANFHWVNNVISGYYNFLDNFSPDLMDCDYNYVSTPLHASMCWGSNSLGGDGAPQIWDTSVIHDFALPAGSDAQDAGIDISDTFTLNSTEYSALPGFDSGYFTGDAPNLGAVQVGATPIIISTPLTPDGVQAEGITSIDLEATTDIQAICKHSDVTGFDFVVESIWEAGEVPSWGTDQAARELGVKFQSSKAGYITKIKFYKKPTDTGTHTGSIWSAGGSLLATGTFINESASGWQTLTLTTPLAIAADTTYVASYFVPTGNWSGDGSYFTAPYTNNYLTVLQDGGVYVESATSAFPTDTFQSYNYWIDVVFSEGTLYGAANTSHSVAFTVAADTAYTRYVKCASDEAGTNISAEAQYSFSVPADAVPPTVTSFTPTGTQVASGSSPDGATDIALDATMSVVLSDVMTPLTTSDFCVCAVAVTAANCCASAVAATVANPTTTTATLTPDSDLTASTEYRVAVDASATNADPGTAMVSTSVTFTTEDGTPPQAPTLETVTNACGASDCASGVTSVVVTATTLNNAKCRISLVDEAYASMSDQFTGGEDGTSHTVDAADLSTIIDDFSDTYYIECCDTTVAACDGYRVATTFTIADGVDPPSPAFTYTLTPTGLTYSVVNGATNPNGTSYTDGAWTAWSCYDRVTGLIYNSARDYDFVGADLSGTTTIPAENFDLLCYTQAWDDDSNTSSVNTYSVKRQNGMSSGASN